MAAEADGAAADVAVEEARGVAVEIISINEEGTQFKLNEANLKAVMRRAEDINAERVVIVSVVGAFRTGKSFLLDLFIRFLAAGEGGAGDAVADAETVPAWVKGGGARLDEGNMQVNEGERAGGFLWRGGQERTTTGVWLFDRPFARTLPSGERVAVVLMDTQGMFDMQTPGELTAAIFGLSTLISSYQIYNISKQIQEDMLQQLDYFTQFSMVALKEFRVSRARQRRMREGGEGHDDDDDGGGGGGGGGDDDDDDDEEEMHPFQRIDFLVRDWQNFEDADDLCGSLSSMEQVLERAMATKFSDRGTRDQIRAAFERIGCFLLPHPGLAVTKPKFDGALDKVETNFLALLDHYCRRVFDEGIIPKEVQGRQVSPAVLARFIKAYASVFRDGRLPQTLTLVEAISSTNNLCAKDEAAAMYRRLLAAKTGGDDGLTDAEMEAADAAARESAVRHYEASATFGDAELIAESRAELERAMDADLRTAADANKHKIAGGMAVFVTPLVVAFFAFALDRVSDVTCDAWSQTCRTVSGQLWLLYMGVAAALAYSMYTVYRERGPLAVSVTLTSLVNTAAMRVQDHSVAARAALEGYRDRLMGVDAPAASAAAADVAAAGGPAGAAAGARQPGGARRAGSRRKLSSGTPSRSKKTD